MFIKKLEFIFASVILLAMSVLGLNYYKSYAFKNNDLPESYKKHIEMKEKEVLSNMQKHYGFTLDIPLIVTDKFQGRLYGLTSYKNGQIKIYLNKKVMKESMEYILGTVIAHEYAHAMMFQQGYMHTKDDGHSSLWQKTCVKLGGEDCQQYVDQQEIIMSKMPF
ncbi:sprT domain-containing protein [Sulfurimonas aquatica]|uniref:SprT domain-containing protein n=1 Tax=Sulfurimonas aquatica TaxID=2672570 RepID=A0A975AZU6_9BACT|nr:SprT-like domain-containing protein [Sulfurimonas aquatica]QSZ41607.1 sprT domain-containing protein [Sulfurimonas aquatica]